MDKNKEVLKHCPHFYTIINFDYYGNDVISEKLIEVYEKFIFNANLENLDNINKIEKLDNILYKYINDYAFRTQVKQDISKIRVKKTENIIDAIVNAIISISECYENIRTRKFQVTRWI